MSLILDALRKLDREKSSRRDRMANIADDILRPDLPRQEKRILRYFAAAALTAVATAAIMYAVRVEFSFWLKSSAPAPVNHQVPSQQIASAPVSREPVPDARETPSRVPPKIQDGTEDKSPAASGPPAPPATAHEKPLSQQAVSAPISREPVRDARETPSQVPPKIQDRTEDERPVASDPPAPPATAQEKPLSQQAVSAPIASEPVRDARETPSQVPPKIQDRTEDERPVASDPPAPPATAQEKPVSQQAVSAPISSEPVRGPIPSGPETTPTTPPPIKLSGILWSEDPSARRAVINGMVLSEGAVMEGVKVIEIGPNSVRLSHHGEPFEVSINILVR
jgi:general secretion pathway protein B